VKDRVQSILNTWLKLSAKTNHKWCTITYSGSTAAQWYCTSQNESKSFHHKITYKSLWTL